MGSRLAATAVIHDLDTRNGRVSSIMFMGVWVTLRTLRILLSEKWKENK